MGSRTLGGRFTSSSPVSSQPASANTASAWPGTPDSTGRGIKAVYSELRNAVRAGAGGAGPGPLRMILTCPEILGWEATWTRAYLSLHRELYGAAKWLEPDREFGLGLWHYYFVNPLLQAEWDLTEFAAACDYIRPILYHLPEGPRIKRYLGMLSSIFVGVSEDTLWRFLSEVLGLDLPDVHAFAGAGLPAEYVAQGVETVRRNSLPGTRIIAGIGVDVFEHGLERSMSPEDVEAAVNAAHRAGADGITISRNYAEMRHANLEAVGRAVRALRAGARG